MGEEAVLMPHARAIRRAISSEKRIVVEGIIWALPRVVTRQRVFVGAMEGKVDLPDVLSVGVSTMVQYVGQKIGRVLAKVETVRDERVKDGVLL